MKAQSRRKFFKISITGFILNAILPGSIFPQKLIHSHHNIPPSINDNLFMEHYDRLFNIFKKYGGEFGKVKVL